MPCGQAGQQYEPILNGIRGQEPHNLVRGEVVCPHHTSKETVAGSANHCRVKRLGTDSGSLARIVAQMTGSVSQALGFVAQYHRYDVVLIHVLTLHGLSLMERSGE